MTTLIYYTGIEHGLSQLLVALQPQLHPDDDIYIIDTTKDLSGLKIAGLYGSTRCYIFVEKAPGIDFQEAVKRGVQNMKENKQDSALVLTDRCVITTTFVANMKRALKKCNHCTLFPAHMDVLGDRMDANFSWYGSSQTTIEDVEDLSEVTKQCKLIRNLPDGEGEHSAGLVTNETIAVLPAR